MWKNYALHIRQENLSSGLVWANRLVRHFVCVWTWKNTIVHKTLRIIIIMMKLGSKNAIDWMKGRAREEGSSDNCIIEFRKLKLSSALCIHKRKSQRSLSLPTEQSDQRQEWRSGKIVEIAKVIAPKKEINAFWSLFLIYGEKRKKKEEENLQRTLVLRRGFKFYRR